jgi:hypothetical protein
MSHKLKPSEFGLLDPMVAITDNDMQLALSEKSGIHQASRSVDYNLTIGDSNCCES